ncbi:MAG: hypothetical protein KQ78_00190 [Candidatus Izimaplasma bacterium HR2]|nr:MAG: hypothetical protein KQ78_00190 [Candidatus Izimaplasma bacterium HR2]
MSKSKRKKNEESKRRFEAIKDLMSTFAMSTVAVIAAVTLIPASPKAEVIKAVALSEEIVYQVNVTDKDNALDLSTLFVVLENQLEFYEQSISLGENSGYFDSLEYDTEYRLSVYGNKGFGKERLDTLMITTGEKIGGTILSVTPETIDFSTTYIVDVSVYDPNLKYTSINLYYGYSWEHDTEIQYSSFAVTQSRMNIELSDIFTSEAFHIYLEGTTLEGTELLDEIWVTPPFKLYTSLHMNYINSEEIGFFIYNDVDVGDISYEMNIYKNDLFIRIDQIILEQSDFEGSEFVIGELSPNTTYALECIATYINPLTLRQEQDIIYQEEISTLDSYTYSYTIETFNDYIEVSIILNDPNNYFELAYYESYDTSGDYDIYLNSETHLFNDNGNDKSITFTIFIPTTSSYQITIGIRNQFDYTVKQIIEIIIFE